VVRLSGFAKFISSAGRQGRTASHPHESYDLLGLAIFRLISTNRSKSPTYDCDWQALTELVGDLNSAIGRIGISQIHSRIRHQRVVLLHQRPQQTGQSFLLVPRRYNNRQFPRHICGVLEDLQSGRRVFGLPESVSCGLETGKLKLAQLRTRKW
jgi:hypothetical protein